MPPTTQTVSFKGEKDQLQGYLARPEGEEPSPSILVIHEVFGLNENIKNITRCFADEGCAALAANLFAGRNRAFCMVRSQRLLRTLAFLESTQASREGRYAAAGEPVFRMP
jgi:dienelactone hydrolase